METRCPSPTVTAQVKSRENEAAAMKHALEPDEAALASVQAELKLLAGAERSNRREAAAMAQIAETDAMVRGAGEVAEVITRYSHSHSRS